MVRIRRERNVDVEVSPPELLERLNRWADSTGFGLVSASDRKWVYRRGSPWAALYSFEIRKYPTEVVVEIPAENPARARCFLTCRTWFATPLPGDAEKLEDDLELLVARICERYPLQLPNAPEVPES